MRIEIVGHNVSGTCSLSGKKETEVFAVQIDDGEVQHVSTQRLPEMLRLLCRVGTGAAKEAPATSKSP